MSWNRYNRFRRFAGAAFVVAQCVLLPSTAQANQDTQGQIRSSTVKNMCEMHRTMFRELINLRGTPGYNDDLIKGIAESEQHPEVKAFLERVGVELISRSSKRRALEFLDSTDGFTQPCYNAMARAYDDTVTQKRRFRSTQVPGNQGAAEQHSEPTTEESVGSDTERDTRFHFPSNSSPTPSYSNQRR